MGILNLKTITIVLCFAALLAGAGLFAAGKSRNRILSATDQALPFTQASLYIGRTKTVTGVLTSVFNNRAAVYLDFGDPHAGQVFRVRITKENWPNFPKTPEEIYHPGDKITVTGKIKWYQGDPVISATSPLDFSPSKQ